MTFIALKQLLTFMFFASFAKATIEIYDRFGEEVDSFEDREAPFEDDFDPLDGYLIGAQPSNACSNIDPPPVLTNFTMGRFVLINGSDECLTLTKLRYADKAGYDVAIIHDAYPMQYHYPISPFPKLELDIQALFVSCEDGIILRTNYLYNTSLYYNYRIRIRPNRPDISYYMYLFGGVIGVCFFVMLCFMMCLLIRCVQERRRLRRTRLSRRQINQIPTAKFSKGDQYDTCAICLEDYKEGEKLRILPCSHAYHSKCIDPWLMHNRRNCPLCKRKINFGDSGDEEDSSDSELTSPAENTPLLISPAASAPHRSMYGTNNPEDSSPSTSSAYQSPLSGSLHRPSGAVQACSAPSTSGTYLHQIAPVTSEDDDDMESLLPPPTRSVNSAVQNADNPEAFGEPQQDRRSKKSGKSRKQRARGSANSSARGSASSSAQPARGSQLFVEVDVENPHGDSLWY